jgi:hypothetical protein
VSYFRKVFKIKAEDSPNVRLALVQIQSGQTPTGEVLVPGILPYQDYRKRRLTWDKVRQCVGLDAEFYEGAEQLLYPPDWLNRAERAAEAVRYNRKREAKGMGIDPAEGGDDTAFSVVDELGVLELLSAKTPNTSVIKHMTVELGRKWGLPPERWVFDRGGGGLQVADDLRERGYAVRTVGFGETVTPEPRRGLATIDDRVSVIEDRYTYRNRRAQMYGELSNLMDPAREEVGLPIFGIPAEYVELRRQLALIPKLYDHASGHEGRLYLPPKRRKPGSTEQSLEEILGCSPDEADATVLAVYGMRHGRARATAGAI